MKDYNKTTGTYRSNPRFSEKSSQFGQCMWLGKHLHIWSALRKNIILIPIIDNTYTYGICTVEALYTLYMHERWREESGGIV